MGMWGPCRLQPQTPPSGRAKPHPAPLPAALGPSPGVAGKVGGWGGHLLPEDEALLLLRTYVSHGPAGPRGRRKGSRPSNVQEQPGGIWLGRPCPTCPPVVPLGALSSSGVESTGSGPGLKPQLPVRPLSGCATSGKSPPLYPWEALILAAPGPCEEEMAQGLYRPILTGAKALFAEPSRSPCGWRPTAPRTLVQLVLLFPFHRLGNSLKVVELLAEGPKPGRKGAGVGTQAQRPPRSPFGSFQGAWGAWGRGWD